MENAALHAELFLCDDEKRIAQSLATPAAAPVRKGDHVIEAMPADLSMSPGVCVAAVTTHMDHCLSGNVAHIQSEKPFPDVSTTPEFRWMMQGGVGTDWACLPVASLPLKATVPPD